MKYVPSLIVTSQLLTNTTGTRVERTPVCTPTPIVLFCFHSIDLGRVYSGTRLDTAWSFRDAYVHIDILAFLRLY